MYRKMFRVNWYNFLLFFIAIFLIIFQPHTIDSLLAIKILSENSIIFIVGFKPANPGMAEIVILEKIFFSFIKTEII